MLEFLLSRRVAEHLVLWVSLSFMLVYSYGYFFYASYLGFNWTSGGTIYDLYVDTDQLREQDQLVCVGSVPWHRFRDDLRQPLLETDSAGAIVPLLIERDGQLHEIQWVLPGINQAELLGRLSGSWWMGYLFWVAGVTVVLLVRPRDQRWWLLLAFMMVTAIWLTLGSGISRRHLWDAAVLFRALLWLSGTLYIHLHWQFPTPLGSLPRPLLLLGYGIAISGAVAEWFELLPPFVHLIPFLIGIATSLLLLLIHYLRQRALRHRLNLLVGATVLAFLPVLAINSARLFAPIPPVLSGGAILGFPLVPMAYVYVASWQQRGWLELRVNPLLTLYLFVFILTTLFIPLASLIYALLGIPGESLLVALCSFVVALIFASSVYPRFRRWVERVLLQVPLIPEGVVQAYVEQITTSPNRAALRRILATQVLPTLFIRESRLLFREAMQGYAVWLNIGTDPVALHARLDEEWLQSHSDRFLAPGMTPTPPPSLSWVRLILPLRLDGVTQGFWLFGARDPDDFYARQELPILRTLANQTTLAVTNIVRSEELAMLYRANVTRSEQERSALARDLHDEILGNLALLKTALDPDQLSHHFQENYALIKRRLRQLATHLRPAMLTYGLFPALREYIDAVKERFPNGPMVVLKEFASEPPRYAPFVELELFRIIQQGVENALRHANATHIEILGQMTARQVEVVVQDNGKGWPEAAAPDLVRLADARHYGVLGMYERARLIDATLQFESITLTDRTGLCVRVIWHASESPNESNSALR